MPLTELLLFVFFDQLISSLIIPVRHDYVLQANIIINGIKANLLIIAYLGSIIGQLINYYLGKIISNSYKLEISDKRVNYLAYGLLIFIPFNYVVGLVSVFAGIVRIKLKHFLIISLILNIITILLVISRSL
jgi:membrane protein YqaA with SNARE-associated domain